MSLPKYGGTRRGVPVLDASTAADPWRRDPSVVAQVGQKEPEQRAEPTLAERARTVVGSNRQAVLSILKPGGSLPLGFVIAYSASPKGVLTFALRTSVKAAVEPNDNQPASITIAETPLTASQSGTSTGVTLAGRLSVVSRGELNGALGDYERVQPNEAGAVRRNESHLYRLLPKTILASDAEGELIQIPSEEYESANADPLAVVAPGLVSHLSNDQGGSLVLLCRAFGGEPSANSAQLAGIDQYGMDVIAQTSDGRVSVRLNFNHPVATPEEVRRELTSMSRAARFKLGVG